MSAETEIIAHLVHDVNGVEVTEGERVRFHQAPGGVLSPASDQAGNVIWKEGVAAIFPHTKEDRHRLIESGMAPDTLHLRGADNRYYHLLGHVIEKL